MEAEVIVEPEVIDNNEANKESGLERRLKNLVTWKPGQSGNPGGRPRSLRSVLQEKYGDGAALIKHAVEIVEDKSAPRRDRLKALELVLDRFEGKPAQTVSLEGSAVVPVFALPVGIVPALEPEKDE